MDTDCFHNNRAKTPQAIYDSFNNLVFSNDTRVIQKMILKTKIYLEVKDLNGDILEFGVFKGASLALWLQLLKLYEYNGLTNVIGFDFFDKDETVKDLDKQNKDMMNQVLSRSKDESDLSIETIKKKCDIVLKNRVQLIKGDACKTSGTFCKENPGLKIKLLYLDMDVDKPTYLTLNNLWEKVTINGLIVLDEYGCHKWDESIGVDRFLKSVKGKYSLENTNVQSPTLIIRKLE